METEFGENLKMALILKTAEEKSRLMPQGLFLPSMGNQGDPIVGLACSQGLEIKSKDVRILYSFFLHCFKTLNRLASGSPVIWA